MTPSIVCTLLIAFVLDIYTHNAPANPLKRCFARKEFPCLRKYHFYIFYIVIHNRYTKYVKLVLK